MAKPKKNSEVKITEIKPKIKIISNGEKKETLEQELDEVDAEKLASVASSPSTAPVLREVNPLPRAPAVDQREDRRPQGQREPVETSRVTYEPRPTNVRYATSADTSNAPVYQDPMVQTQNARTAQSQEPGLRPPVLRQQIIREDFAAPRRLEQAAPINPDTGLSDERRRQYELDAENQDGLRVKKRKDWRM